MNTSVSAVPPPIVLSIAGYDPSAGAGVLADLKTFAAMNVYGMACVTALTIQSTQGVRRVQGIDADIVTETLDCLVEDVSFSSIKVGMLGNSSVAKTVLEWLNRWPGIPVVLDPIIKSSHNNDLLDKEGIQILRRAWLARVNWITPNLRELATLTSHSTAETSTDTEKAGRRLLDMAAEQGNPGLKVVVTGGHAGRPDDLLLTADTCRWYPGERVETASTHGTGCAFSSVLAASIALGANEFTAVQLAKDYVAGALRQAYPVGRGNGPVDHFWRWPR